MTKQSVQIRNRQKAKKNIFLPTLYFPHCEKWSMKSLFKKHSKRVKYHCFSHAPLIPLLLFFPVIRLYLVFVLFCEVFRHLGKWKLGRFTNLKKSPSKSLH